MKKPSGPEGEYWSMKAWEAKAQEAQIRREIYHTTHVKPASPDLREYVQRLTSLLWILPDLAGKPGFYPDIQQDLHAHACNLFEEIVSVAFPRRRTNIILPEPDVIYDLYREAKALLGPMPVMQRVIKKIEERTEIGLCDDFIRFRRKRLQLVELWIRTRISTSATPTQIKRAVSECRKYMNSLGDMVQPCNSEGRYLAIPTAEPARELVAILFGTTPATVRKAMSARTKK